MSLCHFTPRTTANALVSGPALNSRIRSQLQQTWHATLGNWDELGQGPVVLRTLCALVQARATHELQCADRLVHSSRQ